MTPALAALLDDGAHFDAEYRGGLSNHLPMALLALHRLGADSARLQAFAQRYAQRLGPARAAQAWPAGDAWASRLGEPEAWPQYRHLFEQWLDNEDAGDVLRAVLPVLMQGCGAAAFHGLIRTAFAVQSAHRGELADALAYWASRWLDLGTTGNDGAVADVEALLRQLRRHDSRAGLIFQAMQAAARQHGFETTVRRLKPTPDTLPRLARLAAMAYAASGNFTVLHLVTSAHALRVLWPWVEEPGPALHAYWRAFAAAVCAAGIEALPPLAPRPWPELTAAARASDNDHVIKLVDSCREQRAALGPGPWQAAATRACHGLQRG